ncbi:MAG: lysylphosphatidylglycerol synthase transmembrane domain-containing protein [Brevefilum sp.]
MTTEKRQRKFVGKLSRWLIPIAISVGAIWLLLRDIDFSTIVLNLGKIDFKIYLYATLVYFVSYFFRAFSWYVLLRRKVSFKDAFFSMGAGYLLNNLFPFRLGEIGRAVLLDDPDGPSALEVLSSVLVERIFDVFLAAVFVLSMLPRILGGAFDQTLILIAFILTTVGLAVLYLAARFRTRIAAWLERWGKRSVFVSRWIAPKAVQVLEGLSVLNNPGAFLLAFGSLGVSWLIAFAENYIVFQSLYPNPPFWWMIFVLSAGAFGAALPSVPAGLGVFEGVMVAAFAFLGVGAEVAFTHAIVIHALAFIYSNLFGLIGLRLRGEAVVGLYRRVVQRSPNIESVK